MSLLVNADDHVSITLQFPAPSAATEAAATAMNKSGLPGLSVSRAEPAQSGAASRVGGPSSGMAGLSAIPGMAGLLSNRVTRIGGRSFGSNARRLPGLTPAPNNSSTGPSSSSQGTATAPTPEPNDAKTRAAAAAAAASEFDKLPTRKASHTRRVGFKGDRELEVVRWFKKEDPPVQVSGLLVGGRHFVAACSDGGKSAHQVSVSALPCSLYNGQVVSLGCHRSAEHHAMPSADHLQVCILDVHGLDHMLALWIPACLRTVLPCLQLLCCAAMQVRTDATVTDEEAKASNTSGTQHNHFRDAARMEHELERKALMAHYEEEDFETEQLNERLQVSGGRHAMNPGLYPVIRSAVGTLLSSFMHVGAGQ